MPSLTLSKTLTARVPKQVQEAATRIAEARGESLNVFIKKAIEREIREQEEKEFYDSFTLLGQDAEESNVEFAVVAQKEVIDGNTPTR